tara:strand:+ start:2145 stop:3515 length:1371 start_codon:yes stop_codon:yes gene_type:complete
MTQNNTVIEYPRGLSSIPYASFLQIEKYSYDEAQKSVAKSFNDGLGAINRSAISKVLRSGGNAAAAAYASGDSSEQFIDSMLNQYKTQEQKILIKKASGNSVRQSGSNVDKYQTIKSKTINITDENIDPSTVVKLKNGETTTVGQLLQQKKDRIAKKNKGLMASRCMLPLPNEFQYKYGADWNNEFRLGTLALAADDLGRFGLLATGGALAGGGLAFLEGKLTKGSQIGKLGGVDATKIVQGAAKGVQFATNPFGVNSEFNPKNLAGLAGLAPNENSIQFFERMQGREFSFRFELAARNKGESNRIIEIIEWFKRGMHPNAKSGRGSAVVLTFPDVFVLTPKFVKCDEDGEVLGDPIQHPMMPRTKLCALTGLTINTTPFGQLQTVFDGSIPIVTMELQFKETTKLTRVDMEGATYTQKRDSQIIGGDNDIVEKTATSEGGFVTNPDTQYTGEVSF